MYSEVFHADFLWGFVAACNDFSCIFFLFNFRSPYIDTPTLQHIHSLKHLFFSTTLMSCTVFEAHSQFYAKETEK